MKLSTASMTRLFRTQDLINRYLENLSRFSSPRFTCTSSGLTEFRPTRSTRSTKKVLNSSSRRREACDEYPSKMPQSIFYGNGLEQRHGYLQDKECWILTPRQRAVAALEKSLEIDPTNYDAISAGMFEYYVRSSPAPSRFLLAGWLSGNSEKG